MVPIRMPPARPRQMDFSKSYTVPRRFNILTLLILTTLSSVALAIMRAFHLEPVAIAVIFVWFGITGIGIAIFPRTPRKASVLLATIIAAIGTAIGFSYDFGLGCALLVSLPIWAVTGYVTGAIFVSVFMVSDFIDQWLDRRSPGSSDADRSTAVVDATLVEDEPTSPAK